MRTFSIRLPDETYGEISAAAAAERRSPSSYLRNLLADVLLQRSGRLAAPLEAFIADVRASLGEAVADDFTAALRQLDLIADGCNHHGAFLAAVTWIVAHTDRSLVERLGQVQRLRNLRGQVVLNLREFTGWHG